MDNGSEVAMRRQIMRYATVTLVLLAAVAVAAAAQDSSRARTRERERTFVFSTGPEEFRFETRRGRLGINVDLRADPARDSVGARVAGVTPGGPADRAGVRAGDIITRLNGTRLAASEARTPEEDEESSRPGTRLVRLASRLDPGDTVRLDVRRGTQNLTLTFQTGESDIDRVFERFRGPMMRGFATTLPPEGPGAARMRVFVGGEGPGDLELVRLNAGLAEYFGTSEGLLVVDVGRDTMLGLRAGDVILSIGSRRATSPPQAMRILGTYDPGEQVQFEIMRQKRRTNVTGHMPQERGWRIERNSFDFDPWSFVEPMRGWLEGEMPRFEMRVRPPEFRIEQRQGLVRTDGWT